MTRIDKELTLRLNRNTELPCECEDCQFFYKYNFSSNKQGEMFFACNGINPVQCNELWGINLEDGIKRYLGFYYVAITDDDVDGYLISEEWTEINCIDYVIRYRLETLRNGKLAMGVEFDFYNIA